MTSFFKPTATYQPLPQSEMDFSLSKENYATHSQQQQQQTGRPCCSSNHEQEQGCQNTHNSCHRRRRKLLLHVAGIALLLLVGSLGLMALSGICNSETMLGLAIDGATNGSGLGKRQSTGTGTSSDGDGVFVKNKCKLLVSLFWIKSYIFTHFEPCSST